MKSFNDITGVKKNQQKNPKMLEETIKEYPSTPAVMKTTQRCPRLSVAA